MTLYKMPMADDSLPMPRRNERPVSDRMKQITPMPKVKKKLTPGIGGKPKKPVLRVDPMPRGPVLRVDPGITGPAGKNVNPFYNTY